jgi:hypothetical protein
MSRAGRPPRLTGRTRVALANNCERRVRAIDGKLRWRRQKSSRGDVGVSVRHPAVGPREFPPSSRRKCGFPRRLAVRERNMCPIGRMADHHALAAGSHSAARTDTGCPPRLMRPGAAGFLAETAGEKDYRRSWRAMNALTISRARSVCGPGVATHSCSEPSNTSY